LDYAVAAEKAGFEEIWCSDHFHPWFHTNAHAGFAWVWIASAAERTRKARIGTGVTCPILRYNPAIVAQAFATLGVMYPGRIFLGLGTGEAMNEMPVGHNWPNFKERVRRLEEAVKVIKLLWADKFVSFRGQYYKLRKANLYTKPDPPVPLLLAASGGTVAELAGRLADGLITIPFPETHYRNVLFPAFERAAQAAGRDPSKLEKAVETYVSYDSDYDKALASTRCWAGTAVPGMFKWPIYDPHEIEDIGKLVGDRQLAEQWLIGTKPEEHIKHIEKLIRCGFTSVHITSSSPNEPATIEMYAKHVLPYLTSTYKS